jgi:hypothetical protein
MLEKDIPKFYLDILKEFEELIPDMKKIKIDSFGAGERISPEYSISDELLFKLIDTSGPHHSGMPGHLYSEDWGKDKLLEDKNNTVIDTLNVMEKLGSSLMCRRHALLTLYPPGGYIGWHHNGNIPGRNLLFSWSENGDGLFRLYNNKLKNFEDYPDSPGWNVKSLKFYGHLEAEQTGFSWHAMATNCFRFSVAFLLSDQFNKEPTQVQEVLEDDLKLKNKSLNGVWF